MKSLQEQQVMLETLGFSASLPTAIPHHDLAEGIALIPHWKQFGTYNQAVEKVLGFIKDSRPFYNWREGELGSDRFRQTKAKEAFWNSQHDSVLMPVQLGNRWKGKSVETVRKDVANDELGLGAYEVGVILLTHPEILTKWEDLFIDCPGDEYDYPDGTARCFGAPIFRFDGSVEFDTGGVDGVYDYYGSVSGFFPQYLEPQALHPRVSEPSELILALHEIRDELTGIRKALEKPSTSILFSGTGKKKKPTKK